MSSLPFGQEFTLFVERSLPYLLFYEDIIIFTWTYAIVLGI